MSPISIPAIEQEARKRRAEQMQRVSGLVSAQLRVYGKLLAATALQGLIALGESLRPLFAWNPRASASRTATRSRGPALLTRVNRRARGLFAWNPRARRSC